MDVVRLLLEKGADVHLCDKVMITNLLLHLESHLILSGGAQPSGCS